MLASATAYARLGWQKIARESMSSLCEILDGQPRAVEVVDPNGTVLEAVARMTRCQIGCLVVVDEGRVVGLVTERDYLTKVMLRGRTSRTTLVREIMTAPVMVANPHDDDEECLRRMLAHRVKQLPVVDRDALVGLLSRGDLMRARLARKESAPTDRSASGRYEVAG
jgi:CBS domain-containing protein